MTNALKEFRTTLSRAWENLAEGWRELLSRGNDALTRFIPKKDDDVPVVKGAVTQFPSWGLLAGEVFETDSKIVVRIELPGVAKQDCDIAIEGNTLYVRGEKRYDREHIAESYFMMQRAYGSFERAISLPRNVDVEAAEASFADGVLTVVLPKSGPSSARRVAIR